MTKKHASWLFSSFLNKMVYCHKRPVRSAVASHMSSVVTCFSSCLWLPLGWCLYCLNVGLTTGWFSFLYLPRDSPNAVHPSKHVEHSHLASSLLSRPRLPFQVSLITCVPLLSLVLLPRFLSFFLCSLTIFRDSHLPSIFSCFPSLLL